MANHDRTFNLSKYTVPNLCLTVLRACHVRTTETRTLVNGSTVSIASRTVDLRLFSPP